ncbi:MAG: hypothetical protein ACFFDN_37045 [Candidatus Hodarchaeota archaeon]
MKRALAILLSSIVSIVVIISISSAQTTYKTKQITDNLNNDYYPEINNNNFIAWNGDDGHDLEIFLYNGIEISQLTDNYINDTSVHLSDNLCLAWMGNDGNDCEMFYYNNGQITQLTDNNEEDQFGLGPRKMNENGCFVWRGHRGGSGLQFVEIFLYCNGNITRVTEDQYIDYFPAINSNGDVVWEKNEGGSDWEIFFYSNGSITKITNNNIYDSRARINDKGHIIFQRSWDPLPDSSDQEIFFYDGQILHQVSNNTFYDSSCDINNNDCILWKGWPNGTTSNSNPEMFLYCNGNLKQLTNDSYAKGEPFMNNNGYIVWHANDSNDKEIFLYDGTNIIQLTDNSYEDEQPRINENNYVVWHGYDGNDWEIFLAKPNQTPIVDAGDNIQILSIDQACTVIQGIATDVDGDLLEYRWLEGGEVLKDWTSVGINGESELDLGILPYFSIGNHTLTLEVHEVGQGGLSTSDFMILTIDNSPPEAVPAPSYQVVEIGINDIVVMAQASDFDGDTLSYKWLKCEMVLGSGSIQAVQGGDAVPIPGFTVPAGDADFTLGVHQIELWVSDGANEPVSTFASVEVTDTTVPCLSPIPSATILWPPNHTLQSIAIQANAFDNGGGAIDLDVNGESSEPPDTDGDGNTIPDIYIDSVNDETGLIELRLRSERSGKGDGRTYTITITAMDESENQSVAILEILAPHDRRIK